MAGEQTFFSENGVTVTQARFVVPNQTFAMSGVTSVSARTTAPSKTGPIVLILIGIPLLVAFGLGLLLIIGGIVWLTQLKPTYTVVLTSASGQASAYTSRDQELIQRIVAAVTDAIVARG